MHEIWTAFDQLRPVYVGYHVIVVVASYWEEDFSSLSFLFILKKKKGWCDFLKKIQIKKHTIQERIQTDQFSTLILKKM